MAGPVSLAAARCCSRRKSAAVKSRLPRASRLDRVRQPVALAIADGGKTILVANRRSGSISVIDAASRRVVAEHDVGRGLADLAILPDGRYLLAVDQAANDLVLLSYQDSSIQVLEGRRSAPTPSAWSSRPMDYRASWPRSGRDD